MILVANTASQTPPKAEKRVNEIITYTIDCSNLLTVCESIISANIVEQHNISFNNIRTRKGVCVEVSISNGSIGTSAYIDFTIPIELVTSMGNNRIAVFNLRVFR